MRPTADIAYVWTLGDKNTAMDITVPGVNATDRLGYDIMDSGFFVGKLGLEAEKGDWTYGFRLCLPERQSCSKQQIYAQCNLQLLKTTFSKSLFPVHPFVSLCGKPAFYRQAFCFAADVYL